MEEQEVRKCDGHCDRCTINQRTYCAAQMAYYNQQEIAEIKAILRDKPKNDITTIIEKDNALKATKTAKNEVLEETIEEE